MLYDAGMLGMLDICWFAINLFRFIRQIYGGHVRANHMHCKYNISVNDILMLTFLQHGRHDKKCEPRIAKFASKQCMIVYS